MSCSTVSWEEQLALTLENHPRVLAYAKNQALGFEIPYLDGGVTRRYLPDFLVRLDDGGDEPLNLVLEVKGMRDESDKAKAQTTRELWVPGVNALGGFGRWAFAEFRDWAVMDEDFAALVDRFDGRRRMVKAQPARANERTIFLAHALEPSIALADRCSVGRLRQSLTANVKRKLEDTGWIFHDFPDANRSCRRFH